MDRAVDCDECGSTEGKWDMEWTTFGDSYEEELIQVWTCLKCGKRKEIREEKETDFE